MAIFNVRSRTKATVSAHWFSYTMDCKDKAQVCAALFRTRKTEKKDNKVGHFDNEPKITEKKILVSTRTPGNITIKCTGRVATKGTVSFVMSACQLARPSGRSRFRVDRIFYTLWWEIILQYCTDNSNLVNNWQKDQVLYCDLVWILGETRLGKI